ncbi:sulfite exporter TauE/SafE family protein [Propionibacterium australiense]|uniref:Probable membrane transporter protein n=1 Tax=Propionibacterium australiense TaxID=119981 RepID=A0A383S2E1_9ACTN|nr:sulfite exporter TauE/SafE family protein [Propionibacterium australiense]SYZ32165.1 Transmembrane protein TauE-like [Propionibacterium australiense]VEH90768.1 Sulfite exporter TauE/SafE [Propionibacterium australiense]
MPAPFALTIMQWAVLALAAFFVGVAKTALPGLATLSVALFAAVLPARESTAAMVVLLIAGDLSAIWMYRHDVDWPTLRRLAPAILVGLGAGTLVLWRIDDAHMKRMIGVILLLLTAVTLWMMWRRSRPGHHGRTAHSFSQSPAARWAYGSLGGFTTMVANAGGPPMTMYFVASGFDVMRFMGTQAYFFFFVNLAKVPFQAGLGLFSARSLSIDAVLLVPLVLGILLGRFVIRRIRTTVFDVLVIALTIVSSAFLLV